MIKAVSNSRWWWFVVSMAWIMACSAPKGPPPTGHTQTGARRSALSSANGLSQNGMWANGMWANGMWANGMWANGMWANGMWANGMWANGLTGDAAVPGNALRENFYARQLLQYIYSCAMPPLTYDTALDPNNGTLLCSSAVPCDQGYTCSTEGTCVVPLKGAIGVGINADGTTWGASGKCDETCQRWVSACLLARTNAYGVHVLVSMRAPADAPQAIKDALAVSDLERNGDATNAAFALREGAYYGNLFATTPVNPPPAPDYTGPTTGPIASTPSLTACAGPGSNIPQITKRFCSSQGDQTVINVPGVCLTSALSPGVCAGEDTDPMSPTFGAIQDCYTGAGQTGTHYDEVITVYLREPIATCGNSVCETGESETSCRSDCHPGWTRNFDGSYGFGGGLVDETTSSIQFSTIELSAVSPVDDSVVVVGRTRNDVDLGGGLLPASDGFGVLAKLDPVDGHHVWSLRFSPDPAPAPGFELAWSIAGGVTVDANGAITVLGESVVTYCVPNPDNCIDNPVTAIWVNRFSPDGVLLQHYSVPTGNPPAASGIFAGRHYDDLTLTRAVATDAQNNVLLAGGYCGSMRILPTFGMPTYLTSDCTPRNYGETIGNGLFVAKLLPPTFGSPWGSFAWARSLATGGTLSDGSYDLAGYAGLSLSVDRLRNEFVLLTGGAGGRLMRMRSVDGADVWPANSPTNQFTYSVAAVDKSGDVFVSGLYFTGADFGCGANQPDSSAVNGRPPYLMKLTANGACRWVKAGKTICPQDISSCPSPTGPISYVPPQVEGVSISFDKLGNPLLGSFGNPNVGGGIDFGFGTFPAYAANNIFVSAYDSAAGTPLWAKHVPTVLSSLLIGMDLDSVGRVVMSGNYSGSMLVDDRLLVTGVPEQPGVVNSFVASFSEPSLLDATAPIIGSTAGTLGQPAPVETVPKPIVTPATSGAGANVFFMPPTAIDAGGAGTSVVCSPRPNTIFPIGTTTVTCTASDPLGNKSTASFPVTVTDKLAPLFSPPPADVTAQAVNLSGAVVTWPAPSAVDQVDGPVTPVCVPASGSTFPVGRTTVTCAAKDARNNASTVTFAVTVTPPPNTPPVVTVPANITVEATGASGAKVTFTATATDTQDGARPVTCTPASGTIFPLGTKTVSCKATDAGGLTTTATFTVTVKDSKGPTFCDVPGTIKAYATSTAGAKVTYGLPHANDAVDGARPVVCAPASGSQFPLNKTVVTCTASDKAGNKATTSFTVWVTYQAPTDGSFFLVPIRSNGSSIFKIGRPVPVRFKLTGASAGISNLTAKLAVTKLSNTVQGSVVDTSDETVDDTNFTFAFRPLLKFYAYRWKTRDQSQGTFRLTADLGDGVVHQVNVSLRP